MKFSVLGPAVLGLVVAAQASYINYTTVTGYFLQDEAAMDPSTFVYYNENFGLINRTYDSEKDSSKTRSLTQWERFYRHVVHLNKRAPKNVEYKVLFLGRHGEGWHNAAESYYGTPAWNCYWSELDGNGTATWRDPDLTSDGIEQAQIAHSFWKHEIKSQRIHTPDSYYVSPLTRCLKTANITFSGLELPRGSAKFKPLIKEYLREGISIHTCDNRRSRTYIHGLFPDWNIEKGFTEEDELWNGVTAETAAAQDIRSKEALDDVFADKKSGTFVSVTSHSGEIGSILRVVGHRTFKLNTGAVIPVLVKAETIKRATATATATSTLWRVDPHCTEPPVTSVTACVCPSSAAPVTTPLATN